MAQPRIAWREEQTRRGRRQYHHYHHHHGWLDRLSVYKISITTGPNGLPTRPQPSSRTCQQEEEEEGQPIPARTHDGVRKRAALSQDPLANKLNDSFDGGQLNGT